MPVVVMPAGGVPYTERSRILLMLDAHRECGRTIDQLAAELKQTARMVRLIVRTLRYDGMVTADLRARNAWCGDGRRPIFWLLAA